MLTAFARLAPGSVDDLLVQLFRFGLYTQPQIADVLTARDALFSQVSSVDPLYEGYVGSTESGLLVYANSESRIIDALNAVNLSGRMGYYHYVYPE